MFSELQLDSLQKELAERSLAFAASSVIQAPAALNQQARHQDLLR
jgi:hypothetical protein